MKTARRNDFEQSQSHRCFRTTRWTMVLRARDEEGANAGEEMSTLCESYWPPIYAYLRRAGHSPADAKDLAQGFFAHLLEKDVLRNLQRGQGKFRSFLLTCLKNYAENIRERSQAQKRGGDYAFISLEELQNEEHRRFEPAHGWTPDEVFETRWAEAVMQRTIANLRQIYVDAGKTELFNALKDLHPGERGERGYAEIGSSLNLSESGVKTAVRRMRMRHRELLRQEIAATLSPGEDIEEELEYLRQVLNRSPGETFVKP